jgi:hypothetical protein
MESVLIRPNCLSVHSVTRLNQDSPLGRFYILARFFEITTVAKKFGRFFTLASFVKKLLILVHYFSQEEVMY